jgi:glucosamine kinase
MARYLLIDGGRSGLRAVVIHGERAVTRVHGPGLPYNLGGSLEAVMRGLTDLVSRVPEHDQPFDSVVLGLAPITSQSGGEAVAAHLRTLVVATEVVATEDVVTHHAGALGPRPGVVIAAGTGVKALAVAADGRTAVAGAWGYILGDDGSGYAIGRRALAAAFRDLDGRSREPMIREAAEDVYGPLELLSQTLYGEDNPAATVARFVPRVAQLARNGDRLAAAIWSSAAIEMARSTLAATEAVFRPGEPVDIRWAGGLFGAGELLVGPFRDAVLAGWPTARVQPAGGGPLDGALLLARVAVPALEGLLFRSR